MILVENFADGNCMYLAYGISLMYYLRSTDNTDTQKAFTNLGLDDLQKQRLKGILERSRAENKAFSPDELNQIQRTLGPVCRAVAAEKTRQEYLGNPQDSNIFTAGVYGLVLPLKTILDKNDEEFRHYVPLDQQGNLSSAELFRTPGMTDKLRAFATRFEQTLETEFKQLWPEFIAQRASGKVLTEQDRNFYKFQLLSEMASKYILTFFSENSHANLKAYQSWLNQDKKWASEENLLALHRAVTGERMVGKVDNRSFEYDIPIAMGVMRNGLTEGTAFPENPGLILNNSDNTHWQSYIPDNLLEGMNLSDQLHINTLSSSFVNNEDERITGIDFEQQKQLLAFFTPVSASKEKQPEAVQVIQNKEEIEKALQQVTAVKMQLEDNQEATLILLLKAMDQRDTAIKTCNQLINKSEHADDLTTLSEGNSFFSNPSLGMGTSSLALLGSIVAAVFTLPVPPLFVLSVVSIVVSALAMLGFGIYWLNRNTQKDANLSDKQSHIQEQIESLIDDQDKLTSNILNLQYALVINEQDLKEIEAQSTNLGILNQTYGQEATAVSIATPSESAGLLSSQSIFSASESVSPDAETIENAPKI